MWKNKTDLTIAISIATQVTLPKFLKTWLHFLPQQVTK